MTTIVIEVEDDIEENSRAKIMATLSSKDSPQRLAGLRYAYIGSAQFIECDDCKRVIPEKTICPCKGGHDPMRRLLRD